MSRFFDAGGTLPLPEMIELEPTDTCNLRCRSCHVSYMPRLQPRLFDVALLPRLEPLRGRVVSVASGFEPMIHPRFDALMQGLSDLDMRLHIITNGTRLDRAHINTLLACNMELINISFDGVRPASYAYNRRRARYQDVIDKIVATREAFRGRQTYFAINSTTMRQNLDETIEVINFWNARDMDVIRFLLMVVRYPIPELVRQSLYPVRDRAREVFEAAARYLIENHLKITMERLYFRGSVVARQYPDNCRDQWVVSDNPHSRQPPVLRELYQLGDHPQIPHTRCRAPFNSATVLPNGDVQLCFKYTIGNLHENRFDEIWYGETAHRIRQQVARDPRDCRACDCFRFGINYRRLDLDCVESYFAQELIPFLSSVNFATGTMDAPADGRPPQLVSVERAHNIVFYAGRFLAVPHALGPLELDKIDVETIPGIVAAESLAAVKRQVRAMA